MMDEQRAKLATLDDHAQIHLQWIPSDFKRQECPVWAKRINHNYNEYNNSNYTYYNYTF